jgi:hypothetical protein
MRSATLPKRERTRLQRRLTVLLGCSVYLFAMLVGWVGREPAAATPVFAQAYGLQCTACHTQMPELNAFGRYIQRTGYAALNRKTLQHAVPVFLFDIGTGYTHQDGNPTSDKITGPFHSTLLQANGYLSPEMTYKVEQFIWVGGQGGFLEQGWVAYHNLFNHDGHLFVGKLPAINMDEFGDAPLAEVNPAGHAPGFAVGTHSYTLDYANGRWGAKFNLVRGKTLLQVAYLGNATYAGSFQDAFDYSRGTNKAVQWRAAYADPARPWEIGLLGESGSLGFAGAALAPGLHTDNFSMIAPYINKDPRPGSPGFRFEYASTNDSNPGSVAPVGVGPTQQVGVTKSDWMIGTAYQMVLHDHGMVNVTYYHTNQALTEIGYSGLVQSIGPQTGGGPGFSYAINPYSRFYTSVYVARDQRPAFTVVMWFTPPFWSRLK